MSSRGEATRAKNENRKSAEELAAPDVREFRSALTAFLNTRTAEGRLGAAKWGVYAFYDYDGEPIYVGQTKESLGTRIRRHMTNQRTDAVAMRVLDPLEVAFVEVWPLWHLQGTSGREAEANRLLDQAEYTAYLQAIRGSKFGAILNEKIPPSKFGTVDLPESHREELVSEAHRKERGHPDLRIARRAETLSRLAAVARERGIVTAGLRRVIVIQAVRLAYLGAVRLALAEGRGEPDTRAIDVEALVGPLVLEEGERPETSE